MHADLIVIGAGLAGSCLAAAVARYGWNVVLLERGRGARHKVCGEFLSPEAQASLQALGLHATVAALAPAEITAARIISRRGLRLGLSLPGVAWGVSRFALDAALARAAAEAGALVLEEVTATATEQTADGYQIEARAADGMRFSLSARTAAVACGRQPVPGLRPAQAATSPAGPRYVGVKAHYEGLALPPEVRLYLFDGGYVGLSPIEGGRANLCLLATEAAFQRGGGRIPTMLAAVARWIPRLARDLAGAQVLSASMVAAGAIDTEREPVLWDGCARLGDAATMIPPLCGDGQAMAIRAAELCAPLVDAVLAGRRPLVAWEGAYTAAWHREFDGPLRAGRRLQALLGLPPLDDGLVALGNLLPPLARRVLLATRGPQRSLAIDRPPRLA
jgi:menaquinone-9 beta-reductase